MEIKKINALDLAIIVAIFEFFALLLFAAIGIDNTVMGNLVTKLAAGFIIGVVTTIPALFIFNVIPLKIRINNTKLTRINMLQFAIANGLFLAVLFFIESIISWIKLVHVFIGNMIVGFITTFVTISILLFIYNRQPFKLKLFIIRGVKLDRISVFSAALFIAIIEAIILPIMAMLLLLSQNIVWFGIAGLVSGFIGVYLASIIYNDFLSKRFPLVLKI